MQGLLVRGQILAALRMMAGAVTDDNYPTLVSLDPKGSAARSLRTGHG
jgi:hypothetical protein